MYKNLRKSANNTVSQDISTTNADIVALYRLITEARIEDIAQTANINGDAPLHIAAKSGDVKLCERLLDAGANDYAVDKLQWIPLMHAIEKGHFAIAEAFLRRREGLAAFQSANRNTPLHIAARCGHAEILSMMLGCCDRISDQWIKLGLTKKKDMADLIDRQDDAGFTPLIIACGRGHTSCVDLLVEAGADINAISNLGTCPLTAAIIAKQDSIADKLALLGANLGPLRGQFTKSHARLSALVESRRLKEKTGRRKDSPGLGM